MTVEAGRILIADDEETFSQATAELLRREGYECATAPDAATATRMLSEQAYDLLVSDIKMPGNDDLELIEELKHKASGMPVILVTGYPSLQTTIRSLQLPVCAYLVKPFVFSDLLSEARGAIERHRVYRATLEMRERLQDWQRDLADMQQSMELSRKDMGDAGIESVFNLTFSNVTRCLRDLKQQAQLLIKRGREISVSRPGEVEDARAGQTVAPYPSDPMAARMRETLERLANDLEEFGIVTQGFSAPADHELERQLQNLSRREWEIVRLLRDHQRAGTIARSLHLSAHTVRNHLKSVFKKLGVHSQEELLKRLQHLASRP